jgi:hypothetical protein
VSVAQLPDIFTRSQALDLGLSVRELYRLRDQGHFEQPARGLFVRSGLAVDVDLAEIAVRAPEGTLCLASALTRHGLVDDLPARIDVALPRSQRPPRVAAPVRWHRFDVDTFDVGRSELIVHGELKIGLYGGARSVVDAIRLRHLYGEDQAIESLRRWLTAPGSHPAELLDIARHFPPAEPPLRAFLRLLL